MEEYHVRYNPHLKSQFTPDAHGLQLLTDAHLQHAKTCPTGSSSLWVREGTSCRPKIWKPWYATIDPDPDTLVKARADFGKMILTLETIANNPPPWS